MYKSQKSDDNVHPRQWRVLSSYVARLLRFLPTNKATGRDILANELENFGLCMRSILSWA